jgi:hypothetical protein
LAEWSERCASIPKITGFNPSGGSEFTFRSGLLLTARGGCTWALIELACLACYPGKTLCSQCLEACGIQIPKFIYLFIYLFCVLTPTGRLLLSVRVMSSSLFFSPGPPPVNWPRDTFPVPSCLKVHIAFMTIIHTIRAESFVHCANG